MVAVVNDEAITQHDLNEQRVAVLVQLRESKVAPPAPDVLERQVLERMITERSLLQFAKETGVRIDDTTVERAVLRIAQDNKVSPEEFRKVLEREGITYAKYREDIRRELTHAAPARARGRGARQRDRRRGRQLPRFHGVREGGEIEYLLSHILVVGAGAGVARAGGAAPAPRGGARCNR